MAAVRKVREFRGTLFAVLSGSILALGGVFWAIHAFASNPEETQKELAAGLERVNRIADVVDRDRRMEELLAEPRYKEEARVLWMKLDREHAKAHAVATLEREAQQEVASFLRRVDALKRDALLAAKAGETRDELRALQSRYASTSFGGRLRAVEAVLEVSPHPQRPCMGAHTRLTVIVQKAMEDLDFRKAMAEVAAFSGGLSEHDRLELARKLEELVAMIHRGAEVGSKKLKRQCGDLAADGRTAEARNLLEKALRGYEGLPQQPMIRALLQELR